MINRERAIETLAGERFDVAVIGGGITGAGVALDAASRGYSVALVEKGDFASGTSSRSSKLVHGGLRYLQRLDLALVREALLERRLLVALAPHLVRPLPFVVPAFGGARPDRRIGVGLSMYDAMAAPGVRGRGGNGRGGGEDPGRSWSLAREPEWSPGRHRTISGAEVAELVPALGARNPSAGYLFHDCQTDDARLVLTVLGEAERYGATCANRVEAVGLEPPGVDGAGAAVRVRDGESGETFPVRAEHVVNATGVWADRIGAGGLRSQAELPTIVPSRGTHVTLAAADLPLHAGAIVPAGGGRSVFALPWLGRSLIGTTDSAYHGRIDHVQPSAAEVAYLLDAVNAFFGTSLTSSDLTGAFAGLRPLISSGDGRRSVDISRRAQLYETSSGLITITGGKLTTWRRMAKLAVDRLVERDGHRARCRTHEIPLGAAVDPARLPRIEDVSEDAYPPLAARYGHAAEQVLALAAERAELREPILAGLPDLLAEAPFAARMEQARSVADVLLRRTRLALLAGRELCDPGSQVPLRVARALGGELGWDERRTELEVERFRAEARAEGIDGLAAARA